MVSDTQQNSIQLCVQSNFVGDIIKQIDPELIIKDEKEPITGLCVVSIIENNDKKSVLAYVKKFVDSIEKAIFIVPGNFKIPEIKSHSIYFLRKPFRVSQLKQLLTSFFKKQSLQLSNCIIDEQTRSLVGGREDKEKIRLTNKEFDILCFIVKARDSVSKKDILQSVFGYSELSNTNTVDVHLHRLKQKISKHIDISKYIRE